MLEGWAKASIGEIGTVVTGTTPATSSKRFYGGDIPFVAPGDLGSGLWVRTAEKTLTEEGFRAAKRLPKGAVLFTCIGATIGKAGVAARDLATNQQINAVICDPKRANNLFVYYLLALRAESIKRLAGAQAVPIVNKSTFEDVTAPLPPLPEQRKIAEILRTWDEALEKLTALRAAKARRLEGIAQQLLAPSRAIGRGVPQSNWAPSSFGEAFEERQDKNAGLGSDDVVTVGKYAIRKQSEHFTRSVASKDLSNYWTISPGDFVYDPMSAYYGAIGRYAGSADGIVSPAYRVIKLSPDVDPEFMVALLRTHHVRFLLETRSSQGNKEGKRRLLQRDEFESIEFKLPPREAQREIAAKLAVFRTDMELTEREIEALTRQKRGLMQKLLTGEWRVNTTETTEVAQ